MVTAGITLCVALNVLLLLGMDFFRMMGDTWVLVAGTICNLGLILTVLRLATAIARRVPDAFDRGKAVQALKSMDPLVSEKALLPLLSDTNVFARCEAIKVLADLGGRTSIAPLEQLGKDNNVFYSKLAQDALMRIQDRIESADEK